MSGRDASEPSTYNKRDLLLFVQLLHGNGLIEPETVHFKEEKLDSIIEQWEQHDSVRLAKKQGELALARTPTRGQMVQLYKNLLVEYECSNTTELANALYFRRVEELETLIEQRKKEFHEVLQS